MSSEYQIRVSVLPVRVNIDQDAVLCVTRFLKHVNLVGGEKNSSNEEEEDSMFIRSININAIKIKLTILVYSLFCYAARGFDLSLGIVLTTEGNSVF